MDTVKKRLFDIGIVPEIAQNDINNAAPLAKALCAGGLPTAEITCRTDADQAFLIEMKKACPDMLIGAGGILTTQQASAAVTAGAQFISTPGIDPDIVRGCQSLNVPVFPSISTAEDVNDAISMGLDTLKFLSDGNSDGMELLKTLSADFPNINLLPAAGVTESNLVNYLNIPTVSACCGSWMIDEKAVEAKNFAMIEELTRNTINNMLGLSLKHIGINEENGNGAALASLFAGVFRGKVRKTFKGWFGSEYAEIMTGTYKTGIHGHIGIGVNDPDRARRYYEAIGYRFKESTAGYFENGKLEIIYFAEEIGGFAIHIVKK